MVFLRLSIRFRWRVTDCTYRTVEWEVEDLSRYWLFVGTVGSHGYCNIVLLLKRSYCVDCVLVLQEAILQRKGDMAPGSATYHRLPIPAAAFLFGIFYQQVRSTEYICTIYDTICIHPPHFCKVLRLPQVQQGRYARVRHLLVLRYYYYLQ